MQIVHVLRAILHELELKRSNNSTICENEVRVVSFTAGPEERQTAGYTGCEFRR